MIKNRIFYFDFLRAVAIICVIMCHISGFYGDTTPFFKSMFVFLFHGFGLIGVPIFLMISGALLLNKEYTLSYFLKRRFSRIIYPFIFWVPLSIIIGKLFFSWDNQYVYIFFSGNPSITWYFWVLIGIYLFIPIINSFLKEYDLKGLEYFLLIWFAIITLKTFNIYPIFPKFDLINFTGFIGFVILGYYLDNKKFKISDKSLCKITLTLFIVSLMIYVMMRFNQIDVFREEIYLNIPIVIMGSSFYLFVKSFNNSYSFKSIENKVIGKIIVSISICSYGMYYAHAVVINFLKQFDIHSNKLFPIIFVVIIFLSWLLPYLISKIPYLKRFSGA